MRKKWLFPVVVAAALSILAMWPGEASAQRWRRGGRVWVDYGGYGYYPRPYRHGYYRPYRAYYARPYAYGGFYRPYYYGGYPGWYGPGWYGGRGVVRVGPVGVWW